jgi:hypothetical protein
LNVCPLHGNNVCRNCTSMWLGRHITRCETYSDLGKIVASQRSCRKVDNQWMPETFPELAHLSVTLCDSCRLQLAVCKVWTTMTTNNFLPLAHLGSRLSYRSCKVLRSTHYRRAYISLWIIYIRPIQHAAQKQSFVLSGELVNSECGIM